LNIENTINWLERLQTQGAHGIYGWFYRISLLDHFQREIKIQNSLKDELNSKKEFFNLKIAYYHVVLSKILGLDNLPEIGKWILKYQNRDGGFGIIRSDIESTYYALSSLNCINPNLIRKKESIVIFAQRCQTADGGFSFVPDIYPPYIEQCYAGVRIHEILGKTDDLNKDKLIEFVKNLQNSNGGFRRSKYMGISELEYTYKALYILKSISYL